MTCKKNTNGSACVLDFLKSKGVDTVFGYPGGAVIPLYDEYNIDDRGIKHVRTSHEQGATHAADGYARSTGKIGVVIVTSGPGATNTVTGIATAYADSIPMMVITGQVSRSLIGKDAFQEVAITGIVEPITKNSVLVSSAEDLPHILEYAYEVATTGRKGPVLIDIPKDILLGEIPAKDNLSKYGKRKKEIAELKLATEKANAWATEKEKKMIGKIAYEIENSKRPLIYAGGGVKNDNASQELLSIAQKSDIPVITTIMGIGNIPTDHELCMGIAGMHGQMQTNTAIEKCDLLIALGVRFSDRITGNPKAFAPNAKIVQLDIDTSELGKNIDIEIGVKGGIKFTMGRLSEQITQRKRSEWRREIEDLKTLNKSYKSDDEPDYRKKVYSVHNIYKTLSDHNRGAIVATDVGQHQMWTAQHWTFEGARDFITSGGLGTMGFGLGAAIGAHLGNPDKKTILISGDGSIRMNMNELATLRDYNLPIDVYVIYNGHLGMVRQWQRLFNEERYSETILKDTIDFERLAQAFGLDYYEIHGMDDLMDSIEAKKAKDDAGNRTASLTIIRVDENSGVYPIIPAGQSIDKAIVSAD